MTMGTPSTRAGCSGLGSKIFFLLWSLCAALLLAGSGPAVAAGDIQLTQSNEEKNTVKEQNRLEPEEEPLPEIYYSEQVLPSPVLKTRNALLQAARSGDLEKLRPILEASEDTPIVSFGADEDAIAYWKDSSVDGSGRDILAEMIKVFSSGFVHINAGTTDDLYIWPYHFVYPIDKLTAEQEVELYLLIPAQHREDMVEAGGYIGFRAGIAPNGSLVFFVAGD